MVEFSYGCVCVCGWVRVVWWAGGVVRCVWVRVVWWAGGVVCVCVCVGVCVCVCGVVVGGGGGSVLGAAARCRPDARLPPGALDAARLSHGGAECPVPILAQDTIFR